MKRTRIIRKKYSVGNSAKYKSKWSCSGCPALAGRSFQSQLERRVAEQLMELQEEASISDLKFQQCVHLTRANISWKIDFSYTENGQLWFHEAKGFPDAIYKMKFKLYKVYGECPLRISKDTGHGVSVSDTIYPFDYLHSSGSDIIKT